MANSVDTFMEALIERHPAEPAFHQAVREVVQSVMPIVESNIAYKQARILERMVEPERAILFRVPWVDDQGHVQVHRGFRVEMNSAIGPYKGGLRFHPNVNLGILKFLAFEQVFKNSLTTLQMGAGEGGADFDPKGKSDNEVMRFCQSFMNELHRHLGPSTDVLTGDVGVGGREIGFLFGQYKRIENQFTGIITGKGQNWGGSALRPESTGYGIACFAEEMLGANGDGLDGKVCAVSGSGNVAQFTVEKINQLGGKVVTLSDSDGCIFDNDGINEEKLAWVKDLKNIRRGRIKAYVEQFPNARYQQGQGPWQVRCDVAFPCATENEMGGAEAQTLLENGCICVCEGANMPTTPDAVEQFRKARICFGPAKAANAGGIAVSGLEMAQNAQRLSWSREEVDKHLRKTMRSIHALCVQHGRQADGCVDYVRGANIAGFIKVADAMLDQGVV